MRHITHQGPTSTAPRHQGMAIPASILYWQSAQQGSRIVAACAAGRAIPTKTLLERQYHMNLTLKMPCGIELRLVA